MEQLCTFCGLKLDNFSKLVEHHRQEHPAQVHSMLEEKKRRKNNGKKRRHRFTRQNTLPARRPNPRPRTAHEEELNQNGVVNIRSAFQGDIIITRLRNPNNTDVDIYALFANLRERIKTLFMEFYSRRGAFR